MNSYFLAGIFIVSGLMILAVELALLNLIKAHRNKQNNKKRDSNYG